LTSTADLYTRAWSADALQRARRSPKRIVPLVHELLAPASVVDLGCGAGAWLAEFRPVGVEDILGIDGEWLDDDGDGARTETLLVPRDRLLAHDLERPLDLGRRFDLALSLEVAEHLPETAAEQFVRTLTELAPVVLFSAAAPAQGGTGHLNEQWPSYWAARFAARGFAVIDCLRPRIWNDDEVAWYYRQNLLLYASEAALSSSSALAALHRRHEGAPLDVAHPQRYLALARSSARPLYEGVRDRLWAHAPRAARLVTATRRTLTTVKSGRRP
jgi:SAM-dependent methyltransferase